MMINTQGNAGEKRKKLEGLDETGTVKADMMPPELRLGTRGGEASPPPLRLNRKSAIRPLRRVLTRKRKKFVHG